MPPTPQQQQQQQSQYAYAHMAPSPQHSASQPNGLTPYPPHGYNVSFDTSQQSMSQPNPTGYAQSFPNGPVSNPGFARSFGENSNFNTMRGFNDQQPQIYTAVYSGVNVYEMEIGGVACMRRRSDGWLNATQILKVAGVDKGKRTKVLEKEILSGEHEKVQGGYGKYQGTWISYRRGREFCRQYGVEEILRPLLEYDVAPDGSCGQSQQETPTKEQAMAAQRKKFYTNSSLEARPSGPNGTFFSNISPTTNIALAAMNKAARLNSPGPRSTSTPKPSNLRRASQQEVNGSQQSMASDADGRAPESVYNTQHNGEPPRKRMRPDSQEDTIGPLSLPLDASIRSATPTEPNESFLFDNALMAESMNGSGEPVALPPLPSPSTDEQQEKMNLILDLFAEQGRTDYANHRALKELSNEDFNMPLDASANNALHWAATLAKVPLLKLLIAKGASIWRGNAAGQSPLISAVLVNNCWEHSCFPDVLELLGRLIEVRDQQGRTILHHIAVSSGIKGRAPSSKYYLEALLEFLVRLKPSSSVAATRTQAVEAQQTNGDPSSQDSLVPGPRGPINFSRFLAQIVNARDKAGNTALNLVARIGNRSIIQQLVEIHADPTLPNYKGVCARDFIGDATTQGEPSHTNGGFASQQSTQSMSFAMHSQGTPDGEPSVGASGSQSEDLGNDVIASMTSMLTQNLASHKELLRSKTEAIDQLNEQIRELSAMQKLDLEKLQEMKARVKLRAERRAQVANLRREVERKRAALKKTPNRKTGKSPNLHVKPEWLQDESLHLLKTETADGSPSAQQRQFIASKIPSAQVLQARLHAYNTSNHRLQQQADQLRAKSTQLEEMYRKVVALCTGVEEDKVEESLPALVAAVESERGGIGEQEVGRVRDFLRRVDGSRAEQQASLTSSMSGVMLQINPTVTAAAERAAAAERTMMTQRTS